MATIKQIVGTRTDLAFTGLNSLASATYVRNTTAYDCSTNQPIDVAIEIYITPGNAPTGNKQVLAFIQESLDGTNYRSGPSSGTTATDEPNLKFLGAVPVNTASGVQIATFSLLQALGYVPKKFYVVLKNDAGQALAASGNSASTSEISSTVA